MAVCILDRQWQEAGKLRLGHVWGGGNGRGMSCKLGTMEEEKSGEGLNEFSDISVELSTSVRETHRKLTYRMW